MRIWRLQFEAILVSVVLVLVGFSFQIPLEARPGGGQSYHSGGGGFSGPSYGGSHGSYSGGSGDLDWPVVAGILIIIFVYAILATDKKKRRALVQVNPNEQKQGLVQLQKQDPGFSVPSFLQRTKLTVEKVNQAWITGSMEPARRLISDGVFVRFQTQIHLLKSQGLRNFMLDWRVVGTDFLAAESDSLWETVYIKITGEARDVDVPAEASTQEAIREASSAPLDRYQEVWSFLRRRGKLSRAGVPVLEGHCPNCGADLPISASVRCEHCQAIVNSGEYDFVLAEITQPEEWRLSSSNQVIPGLFELQKRDPVVSRQELEDRASVLFWKWVEAKTTGNLAKLERFCAHSLTLKESQEQLLLTQTRLREVAVGSADLIQVFPSVAENQDRALVEIRWSASIDGSEPQNAHSVLSLARSSHVTSKRGLSCLDCPVCGGPLAGSDAVTCSYCGENISGSQYEWALESIKLAS